MLQVFKKKKDSDQANGKVRNQAIGKGPKAKVASTPIKFYGSSNPLYQLRYNGVSAEVKAATGYAPNEQEISIACGMADALHYPSTLKSICDSRQAVEWENFSAQVVALVSDALMHKIAQKEADQREKAEQDQANKDATVSFWRKVTEFNDRHEDSKLSRKQVKHFLEISGFPVPGKGKGSTPDDDLTEAVASLARLYRLKHVIAEKVAQALLLTKDHFARFGIEDIQEATVLAENSGKTAAAQWSDVDDEALRCFDGDKELEAGLRTERVDFEVKRRLEACEQLAREQEQVAERREEISNVVNRANNLFDDADKMTIKKRGEILFALAAEHELAVAKQAARDRWLPLTPGQQALVDSIWDVLDDGDVLISERGAVIESIKKFPKAEKLAAERAAATQLHLYQALAASAPAVHAGTTEVRMENDIAVIARDRRSKSPVRGPRDRRSRSRSQSEDQA